MPTAASSAPEQGQLVSVRQRQFVVSEVVRSALPDVPLKWPGVGAQHLVTLSSVEDDALGEELQIIWELEPAREIIEKVALPEPTGFDPPERLDAFLDAVRWGAASTADMRSFQAPFRSGIQIEDYQLDPVVRSIQMPRANLLIADDVGLGKTIEAGMVISELIIRHRARRVLVACPAALQVQWLEQMRDKFGLEFRIVDAALMKELRRRRGIHVNPWTHFPRLITSIDFLKRERPLRLFKETLPAEGESIYPRRYDVLVLDEAHNCAPSGRGRYATDSLRTEAVRALAPHFEHKLFLTATLHNGYPESFTALLELLDNQRFARGTTTDSPQFDRQLKTIMVRRLKSELKKNWDGTPRFADRVVEPLEVEYPAEEKRPGGALCVTGKGGRIGFPAGIGEPAAGRESHCGPDGDGGDPLQSMRHQPRGTPGVNLPPRGNTHCRRVPTIPVNRLDQNVVDRDLTFRMPLKRLQQHPCLLFGLHGASD